MEVIKRGVVPKPKPTQYYEGECFHCGQVVRLPEHEAKKHKPSFVGDDVYFLTCEYRGCGKTFGVYPIDERPFAWLRKLYCRWFKIDPRKDYR